MHTGVHFEPLVGESIQKSMVLIPALDWNGIDTLDIFTYAGLSVNQEVNPDS